MLSPPDVQTSTSLVLSGSGVPGRRSTVACRPAAVPVTAVAACDGCSWRSYTRTLDDQCDRVCPIKDCILSCLFCCLCAYF